MDDAVWLSLAVVLTVLAAGWTWFAWRRRGVASGVRGAAITLLPMAAYLTGTLEAAMRIADVVGDWATGLVFRPSVWVGIALAGLAVALFLVSGFLRARSAGRERPAASGRRSEELPAARKGEPAIDDDLADIEAILKKHGIS